MKIKIATIITQLELGGAQQIALYTASHLDALHLDALHLSEQYESYFISGETGVLDDDAKKNTAFTFYQVPDLQRLIKPFKDIKALIKLTFLLRKIKPTIVHTHSSKAGILGRWAAFFARVPVIIHTYHGFGFHDFQNPIIKKIYVLAERITAWVTTRFIVVSKENIKKAMREHVGKEEKYDVVYYGIEKKFFDVKIDVAQKKESLGIPADSKIVGMVACFKPQKSPLDFVHTAARVCETRKDVYFMMVGDGYLRPQIEAEIEKHGLEKRVILTGWRNDVEELIKIFDVFLLTSLWEGQPIVLMQSIAEGVPVVATPVDGTAELIEHGENGYLVPCHDVEKMSEYVLDVLSHPEIKQKFLKANKDKKFDLDNMVLNIQKIYEEELLNRGIL